MNKYKINENKEINCSEKVNLENQNTKSMLLSMIKKGKEAKSIK